MTTKSRRRAVQKVKKNLLFLQRDILKKMKFIKCNSGIFLERETAPRTDKGCRQINSCPISMCAFACPSLPHLIFIPTLPAIFPDPNNNQILFWFDHNKDFSLTSPYLFHVLTFLKPDPAKTVWTI
jgi:hypothetical protein